MQPCPRKFYFKIVTVCNCLHVSLVHVCLVLFSSPQKRGYSRYTQSEMYPFSVSFPYPLLCLNGWMMQRVHRISRRVGYIFLNALSPLPLEGMNGNVFWQKRRVNRFHIFMCPKRQFVYTFEKKIKHFNPFHKKRFSRLYVGIFTCVSPVSNFGRKTCVFAKPRMRSDGLKRDIEVNLTFWRDTSRCGCLVMWSSFLNKAKFSHPRNIHSSAHMRYVSYHYCNCELQIICDCQVTSFDMHAIQKFWKGILSFLSLYFWLSSIKHFGKLCFLKSEDNSCR